MIHRKQLHPHVEKQMETHLAGHLLAYVVCRSAFGERNSMIVTLFPYFDPNMVPYETAVAKGREDV